eukprot:TRINITY_DN7082_c0_g1_i1.p2 TRINITY_DN7082_c0_g1~~TRINITY_DN7082_c0_g1_i1.p2  ORF type:complete len:245 (-),score=24.96 TRINITY_DN7082_c0_g1_i1:268-1002(-)
MASVDLGKGYPSADLIPANLICSHGINALASLHADALNYGDEAGPLSTRLAVSELLAWSDGPAARRVPPENIFMTCGVSQALDIVCTLLTSPGDTVLVEDPCYWLALDIFRDHGLDVRRVRTDADGLSTDHLEQLLADGLRTRFVYTVPDHNNPTSVTMPQARRDRLVWLAAQREDDRADGPRARRRHPLPHPAVPAWRAKGDQKEKSKLELLAEERDYKRRRQTYRAATSTSPSARPSWCNAT